MARLIVSIVFFIILAVFVALNVGFDTSINLFGFKVEEISVVAVILGAMAVGILYSFSLYLSSYLARQRATKVKKVRDQTKVKEKELETKEKSLRASVEQKAREDIEGPSDLLIGEAAAGNTSPEVREKRRTKPKRRAGLLRRKQK